MAKYLVETYYTCSFKVSHYLDDINEANIQNLEKREDGKFEILDVKLDNRKTKNLDKISKTSENNKEDSSKIDVLSEVKTMTLKIFKYSIVWYNQLLDYNYLSKFKTDLKPIKNGFKTDWKWIKNRIKNALKMD